MPKASLFHGILFLLSGFDLVFQVIFTLTLTCFSLWGAAVTVSGTVLCRLSGPKPRKEKLEGVLHAHIKLQCLKADSGGSELLHIPRVAGISIPSSWKNNISQHLKFLHELAGGQSTY